MQAEHRDIIKPETETFSSASEPRSNRNVSYESVLEFYRRAWDDAITAAKLHNVFSALEAFSKFNRNISPTREKLIINVAGRKHYILHLKNDSTQIELKRENPLEISFEKGEELVIAYNEKFNLSGIGSTREEALKDLIEFFIHDYLSYKNTPPEKLSPEAKLLLQQYEDVIETCTRYESPQANN